MTTELLDITQEQAIAELEAAFPTATVFAARQLQSTFSKWSGKRLRKEAVHVSVLLGESDVSVFHGATLRQSVDAAIAKGGKQ